MPGLLSGLAHALGGPRLRVVGAALLLSGGLGALLLQAAEPREKLFERHRLKMVEEYIAREGIEHEAVLSAMRQVPRHLFVTPELRGRAYEDQSLPIGFRQTLSPPHDVAYETASIDPKPTDRVLEIGTGSGYQAAVLSRIVQEVYTIEIVEPLAKQAAARLQELGYTNIKTKIGDGYKGWAEYAPFDKILVTCSPEDVPQALVEQLKEGGKMIIPLGQRFQQNYYLLEKHQGKMIRHKLVPTLFVPMTGLANAARKSGYDGAHPTIANGDFEESTDDVAECWYYVRQATLEHTDPPQGKSYMTFANYDPGRPAEALQAFGIDGSKVRKLSVSLLVKAVQATAGNQSFERPALIVRFFDADLQQVGMDGMGPWLGTFAWTRFQHDMRVPPQAQMAVMWIGLSGATGRLSVDDVSIKALPREGTDH